MDNTRQRQSARKVLFYRRTERSIRPPIEAEPLATVSIASSSVADNRQQAALASPT